MPNKEDLTLLMILKMLLFSHYMVSIKNRLLTILNY